MEKQAQNIPINFLKKSNNPNSNIKNDKIWLYITEKPLENLILDIIEFVKLPNVGAISSFMGTTRNYFNNLNVKYLFYECYLKKTLYELENITKLIYKKYKDVKKIAIFHRIGQVNIKESSVLIYISSSHRKDSLEAVNFAINTLKATVPIWKKEVYIQETPSITAPAPQWKVNKEWSVDN